MKRIKDWVVLVVTGFLVYIVLTGLGFIVGVVLAHSHWLEILLGTLGGMFVVKVFSADKKEGL